MVYMKDIYAARATLVDRTKGMHDYGVVQVVQMQAQDRLGRMIAAEAGYNVTRPDNKFIEDIYVDGIPCDIKIDFECGWGKCTGNIFIETESYRKKSKSLKYPLHLYIYAALGYPEVIHVTLTDFEKLKRETITMAPVSTCITGNKGVLLDCKELEDKYGIDIRLVYVKKVNE